MVTYLWAKYGWPVGITFPHSDFVFVRLWGDFANI